MNLSKNYKITRVENAAAAGQTALTSDSVDMANFEGVEFEVIMGAITAGGVQSAKLQQSSDDGSADDFSDIEGSSQTIADDDDNQVFVLEVHRPTKRYVRCVVSRATQNSVLDAIVARQYGGRVKPSTNGATIGGVETHASPAEGTA